jgi:hypothetical protein
MTAPVVLLVAVAAGSNGVAMTQEAAAACLEAMPAGARTIVRVVSTMPNDLDLAADASAERANAVVVLTWHDAAFLTTDVRVSLTTPRARAHDWIARTVVFSARDLPAERGRTLGLVIAAMLQESWGTQSSRDRDVSVPPPATGGEPRPIDAASVPTAIAVSAKESPEVSASWAIEANLTTVIDSAEGFDVDALGGTFALRRLIAHRLALRAGLGYRVATVDDADATTRTASLALGGAWTSPGLGRPHEIGFGGRLDITGLHEEIRRDSQSSSPPYAQGYWSLGGDLLGQIGYGLSRGTALLFGGGLEETLTAADVVVAGRVVATVPHQRLVFELGVLSSF